MSNMDLTDDRTHAITYTAVLASLHRQIIIVIIIIIVLNIYLYHIYIYNTVLIFFIATERKS